MGVNRWALVRVIGEPRQTMEGPDHVDKHDDAGEDFDPPGKASRVAALGVHSHAPRVDALLLAAQPPMEKDRAGHSARWPG